METIYKYTLLPSGNFNAPERCEIEMPKSAQILSVQNQKEDIVVYALVDPDSPMIKRKFSGMMKCFRVAIPREILRDGLSTGARRSAGRIGTVELGSGGSNALAKCAI